MSSFLAVPDMGRARLFVYVTEEIGIAEDLSWQRN